MTAETTDTAMDLAPRLEMLDPATLLVDVNIRHSVVIDKDFVASIKDLGVLVPIVAVRADDGQVRVRYGHRRVLGAIEAGRSPVPVVVAGDDSADTDAQVARILGQLAENTDRTGLTQAERVGAFEQLSAFGLSPTAIAKRTRTKRGEVKAGLTVAGSRTARDAAERYDFLDLTQAAVLAEFDDDPDAVKDLVVAARRGGFDHAAQRLRDARQERENLERATADLAATGVRMVDKPAHDSTTVSLNTLLQDGEPLTEETHRNCPGHAAYLTTGYGPTTSPEPAHSDDPTSDDNDEAATDETDGDEPAQWVTSFTARYVCTAPDAYGHTRRWASPTPGGTATGGTTTGGPMSDEQKEERRQVIANNAAWRSAETVRRTWLRTYLTRRTPPKGAGTFVASCLASADHELRRAFDRGHDRVKVLLAPSDDRPLLHRDLDELIAQASEQRTQVITLALILAAYEDALDVHTWRRPTTAARRYLTALQGWGYEPSDVERLVTNPTDNDPSASTATPDAPADVNPEYAAAAGLDPGDDTTPVPDDADTHADDTPSEQLDPASDGHVIVPAEGDAR